MDLENEFEGCSLTAYPDPASGGDPWTIGYGHTGPEVYDGLTITQEQADAWLAVDKRKAQDVIDRYVTVHLTANEDLALRDFIFNLGGGNFRSSTLLRKLNLGDFAGAADEFEKWDHACGKVVAGLLRRRTAEKELFEEGEA